MPTTLLVLPAAAAWAGVIAAWGDAFRRGESIQIAVAAEHSVTEVAEALIGVIQQSLVRLTEVVGPGLPGG